MRTKKEILSELFKPYVEKLSNIEKLLEFSGSLTTKGWEIVEQAMDEWHKECLPTDQEIEEFLQEGYRNLYYSTREGIRWCRDFKREKKILCVGCGKNITDETQFRLNNRIDMAFCGPNCEIDYFRTKRSVRGDFVWDGKDSVKFVPDENGTVTIINNSK